MTTGIFLAIFLPISFFLAGLLLYYMRSIDKTVIKIEEGLKPVREMSNWIQRRGLETTFKSQIEEGSHSLPPEKAAMRDELLRKAKVYGITQAEATELRNLLQEDAQSDLAKGLISFLAFLGIMAAIMAFINAITKK